MNPDPIVILIVGFSVLMTIKTLIDNCDPWT